jgi:ketohexokinase
MARILGVGIATLDIINTVDSYPLEDSEQRAKAQQQTRGGNATNTLVVLSQLGHSCHWAGTLADDGDSQVIRRELEAYGVDLQPVQVIAGGHAPTSYITLNAANGSRTIVHYRDLPEYPAEAFQALDLTTMDWLHFEGRNVEQSLMMLKHAKRVAPQLPISIELEKPREGMERLCGHVGLLLYSRYFVEHAGYHEPRAFLAARHAQWPEAEHVCTWGDQGAFAIDEQGNLYHSPAVPPPKVVDTLGAGDAFNAGMIHARLQGLELSAAMKSACELAGRKCGQRGLHGLGATETEK